MTEYARFRQRLDVILRTQDVKQVQDFLIAEGQWNPGSPADPTFAMWMMIAGSPTLSDLHRQAQARQIHVVVGQAAGHVVQRRQPDLPGRYQH